MHTLFSWWRRGSRVVVSVLLVFLAFMLAASRPAMADTVYPDRSSAMAGCQAQADTANQQTGGSYGYYCDDLGHAPPPVGATQGDIAMYRHFDGTISGHFYYQIAPVNPCDGMSGATIPTDGRVLEGSQACVAGPRQSDGSQAQCGLNINPVSPPTFDSNRGTWTTFVSVTPTGQICGLDGGEQGGPVVGPDGAPADAPPIPDPLPPSADPPKICGDVSCYDPATDNYCASSGGQQFCVPGSTARSPSGGCTSSGDATLCAGAPTPPPPDPGKVPDPPTAATGTDHTTQSGGTTMGSGTTTVTTTTYSNTGSAGVSSGAEAGDSTPTPPASSSTAPTTPSTFSGGGSCTAPPACTGDAVMCGVARTQWATTCQLHKDIAGDGKGPPTLAADLAKYSQGDVWVEPTTGNTVGDAANAGNYDESGGGAPRTCPLTDFHFSTVPGLTVPFSKGCDPLNWLAWAGIGFALFGAYKITAGGIG